MNSMQKLKSKAHVHFIGICGTAMASLAGLMKSMGYQITGSDQNVYPPMSTQLKDLGIPIKEAYKKENLNPRPDLVIVGNVISRTHEEAKALLDSDIPYTSLPKALGEYVIADRHSIVIAGTHGKTTTTSMMVKVADECGIQPGFLVGGIPLDFGRSFQLPKSDFFIIEGDEYDTAFFDKVPKFVHYKPKTVILTGIEFDHADIYKDLDAIKSAFAKLIDLIPVDGHLIAYADDINVMELSAKAKCQVITYGVKKGDYRILDREIVSGRNSFSVIDSKSGKNVADIAIKSPGEYNALNALSCFLVAKTLNWNLSKSLQGLASFQGVKRRQEVFGTPSGITLIEDFAHHPTAVRLTIGAIREKYLLNPNQGRLLAVFEPRSATSRRKVFQSEYAKAFRDADRIYIAKAYDQSKIIEEDRFSTAELVNDLNEDRSKSALEMPDPDAIVSNLTQEVKKGDVVLIMSNGGFGGIYQKLLKALSS